MVIDLFGLAVNEVRDRFPDVHQWILNRVKPERDAKATGGTRDSVQYARDWWLFGKPRSDLREAIEHLPRYIATVETSKHRVFTFLDNGILPDNMLVCVALGDALFLGVLSSRIHVTWALAAGGRLGVGNDPRYNKTRCFDPYPFPNCSDDVRSRVRHIAEQIDAHRKRRQALHSTLKITDMYNVLERLKSSQALSEKEKEIHDQGLVSVLKQLHDELDEAVFDAYGWPHDISDEEILRRLVALNRERAEEEKRGIIRWLRPEYQNPDGPQAASTTQGALPIEPEAPEASPAVAGAKRPWPKTLPEQAQAVRAVLAEQPTGLTPEQLARLFLRANTQRVTDMLNTLVSLGQARALEGGRYVPT